VTDSTLEESTGIPTPSSPEDSSGIENTSPYLPKIDVRRVVIGVELMIASTSPIRVRND
jgi:hypothetical protein